MADTGPVLNIPISAKTKQAVGNIAQQATAARTRVAALKKELLDAQMLGQRVSAQQVRAYKEAEAESDRLNALVKRDRATLSAFRRERAITRAGVSAARSVASGLAQGQWLGVAEGIAGMAASPRAARLAQKVGLGGAQQALLKYMPIAYLMKEGFEFTANFYEQVKKDRHSTLDMYGKFARGEISQQQMHDLLEIGGDPETQGGRWKQSGRIIAGMLNDNWSTSGRREQILRENQALGSDQKHLWYLKQAAKKQTDWWLSDAEKQRQSVMIDQYARTVKTRIREYERQYGPADENAKSRISQELVREMRGPTSQWVTNNWMFFDNIEEMEKMARGQADKDAAIRRAKHPNGLSLSDQAHRNIEIRIREAQFQEYHRGYVPFNRNE